VLRRRRRRSSNKVKSWPLRVRASPAPASGISSALPVPAFVRLLARSRRALLSLFLVITAGSPVYAHGVALSDKDLIRGGQQIAVFLYLGAKHMVTGYDHLLFLFGVIFFLYHLRDVAVYVTLFAVGHSITLLSAVLGRVTADAYLVDAIIGLSVVYKALDNMGAFKTLFGAQPNTKAAVLLFGLVHGFGLGTKLQEFGLSADGLVANLLSFNVGVEVGQLAALSLILIAMGFWRRSRRFYDHAFAANTVLMTAGFGLVAYQLTGYALQ
jgi:hypothetical protein